MCSNKDVAQGFTLMTNNKQYNKTMVVNLELDSQPSKKTYIHGMTNEIMNSIYHQLGETRER